MKHYIGSLKVYSETRFRLDESNDLFKFTLEEHMNPAEVLEFIASEWHLTSTEEKAEKIPTDNPNVFEYGFKDSCVEVSGYQEINKAIYELLEIIPEIDVQNWFLEDEL
jgi:hypothetical protein